MATRHEAKRTARALWTAIAAAAWSVGCTSDPAECPCSDAAVCVAPDDAGVEAEVAVDADVESITALCEATFGFQTNLYDECCSDAEKSQDAWRYLRGSVEAIWFECNKRLKTSASQGRIELDTQAAASCAEAFPATFQKWSCEMIFTAVSWEETSCRGAVIGRQPSGAPCRYRYECEDGLFCYGYTDGLDGTCGEPSEGGNCRAEESLLTADDILDYYFGRHPACVEGRVCQHTGNYGYCAKTAASGGHCVYDTDCEPGLRCHLGVCGAEGPADVGGVCRSWLDCKTRLVCAIPSGAVEGTCVARKGDGEACTTTSDECKGACVSLDGGTEGVCVAYCGSG